MSNSKNKKKLFDDASVYDDFKNSSGPYMLRGRSYNIKITTDLDYFISPMICKFLKLNPLSP